ncbi:MAG: response regulator [Rhodoferax sp.]|uniref:hybrid sensor histidine kinase/response regulator n=1 Tax=Rhodoferax sp. TaxID=50421 RepID=UPI001B6E9976|nr:ATP-binding protein [Rhodoferax sp.]MBP9904946.1 response regulator [Rhodoferax sp.]
MRVLDIRSRMLLVALLPVALVSTVLALVFMMARFDDLQESYALRTRALARQVALASEYGLFSANTQQLQVLLTGVMQEPDVRWVAVYDRQGVKLVSAGEDHGHNTLVFGATETLAFDAVNRLDWLAQPIWSGGVQLDDLYESRSHYFSQMSAQLGQVQLAFSRHALDRKIRNMWLLGALIGALGLVFGLLLALLLSRGVIRPIQRVSHLIGQIGSGNFREAQAVLTALPANDPLQGLQQQLRQMAGQLALAREDLQQQVQVATQALREKKDEAEHANLAKSRFLAAASHDLRQPVHALGLFVTRLAQLQHDTAGVQLVGQLEASVLAMQNLLDGLLDMSRLEAGAVPVNMQPFALTPLLSQLAHDLGGQAAEKGLRLRIRPTPLWVRSDPTLVYRMLLNLTANAVRYTSHGGVLISARPCDTGKTVLLQVWDTGIGIAPEHQAQVFAEFYQVGNAARDRTKGLGLGLNIVRRTAELLGLAAVQLHSVPGRGSRFGLSLPRIDAPARATTPILPGLPATDGLVGACILVIEDDAMVRAALTALLDGWQVTVLAARDEYQAIQLLSSGPQPGVIISDYRLEGGQNGIAVVRALRVHLGRSIPACLVSGDTSLDLIQAAQQAGMTLLHKPVRPAKLRTLLRRLLTLPDVHQ